MERKLTAILSADVEGYSRLMSEDEEATVRTLTYYQQQMTHTIQGHRGRVVDSPGDYLGAAVGAGRSELKMSATAFHLPSGCFFQTVTYLPRSVTGLPCTSCRVNS